MHVQIGVSDRDCFLGLAIVKLPRLMTSDAGAEDLEDGGEPEPDDEAEVMELCRPPPPAHGRFRISERNVRSIGS